MPSPCSQNTSSSRSLFPWQPHQYNTRQPAQGFLFLLPEINRGQQQVEFFCKKKTKQFFLAVLIKNTFSYPHGEWASFNVPLPEMSKAYSIQAWWWQKLISVTVASNSVDILELILYMFNENSKSWYDSQIWVKEFRILAMFQYTVCQRL